MAITKAEAVRMLKPGLDRIFKEAYEGFEADAAARSTYFGEDSEPPVLVLANGEPPDIRYTSTTQTLGYSITKSMIEDDLYG